MKFSCDKRELISALGVVLKAVPTKTTMPILECIKISTHEISIGLSSNDMEFAIESSCTGYIEESGAVCVDAKLFNEIVRKLPDGEIHFNVDEVYQITIKCGKAKFQIPGRDASQFPDIPDVDDGISFEIAQPVFKDIIMKTIFCAAVNDSNKVLTSEYIEVDNNTMKCVALDGHRIGIKATKIEGHFSKVGFIVPGRSISEIAKSLNGGMNDKVFVTFTDDFAMFETSGSAYVVRLISGKYFDYAKLERADFATKIYADRDDMLSTVNRCSVLIREGDRKPLVCDIKGDIATLSVTTTLGKVTEDIEIENEGQDFKIGMNARFILEALNAIDDNEIEMRFVSPKSPIYITKDDEDYTYIVLPVNLA